MHKKLCDLGRGNFVGEEDLILNRNHTYSVITKDYTTVYACFAKDFSYMRKRYLDLIR